jgi:hypothetical protein
MSYEHDKEEIYRDLFNTICGEQLGRGAYRTVYAHALDPSLVVKVERAAGEFHNIAEWNVWNHVNGTEHSKWFARCVAISPNGMVLIQNRTQPARPHEYPKQVPAFMTDLKRANWGRLGNRLVAHDYGLTLLMENGMSKRMRKADWWGDT